MRRTKLVFALILGLWGSAQAQLEDPYVGVGLTLYQLESTFEGDY